MTLGAHHQARMRAFMDMRRKPLMFTSFERAYRRIDRVLDTFDRVGLAQNLLVLGKPGEGKSTLAALLRRQHPEVITQERDLKPVVLVETPAVANIGSIASAILKGIGDPYSGQGTISEKAGRIGILAKACGVKLLLINEAQHLYDRGQYRTRYQVGDWLKTLVDDLSIPMVLMGLPRTEELLNVNDQLRRRFTESIRLGLKATDAESGREDCYRIFTGLCDLVGARLDIGLMGWQEFGERLWYASSGRVGYLSLLLEGALLVGRNQEELVLSPSLLVEAFACRVWPDVTEESNPFADTFAYRRLDRAGEPFAIWSEPVTKRGGR